MLKRLILLFVLSNVLFQMVFSDEIELRRTDDSKIITYEMVDPTDSDEARNEYNIGTKYLDEDDYERAEYHLLQAIEFDMDFADALDHLGLVYRKQGKYEEAEGAYLRSIEIMPTNIVPYLNLAIVYRYQGKNNLAKDWYLKAYEIDKNEPEVFFGLGSIFYSVNYYNESIQYYKIAFSKYAERNSALDGQLMCDSAYMIAESYYRLNDYDEALKYYKVALVGYKNDEYIINRINEIENKE